jgi:hypothetical protein
MAKETTRKTVKKAAAKPKADVLPTRAEAFYIEAHFGQKEPGDIAADLGLKVAVVFQYIETLKASGMEPAAVAPKPTALQRAGYGERAGTVVATEASSTIADDHRKDNAKKPINPRHAGSIHIIDPSRPVR